MPGRLGTSKYFSADVRRGSAEWKRLGRVMALPGFKAVRHDAHVKAWKAQARSAKAACRLVGERELHDAHVKAARANPRVVWHIWGKHKPNVRVLRVYRRKKEREQLTDAYITRLLTNSRKASPEAAGIPRSLVEVKRAHLMIVRYLKQVEGENE